MNRPPTPDDNLHLAGPPVQEPRGEAIAVPKLVHRAPEGRKNPIRPRTSGPVPSAAALLRRARRLELDAERLACRRRRPLPSAVDDQAVELLGIVVRKLLHLVERAHREGRWLDLYGAEPYEETTPYVRLMPQRPSG